MKEKNYFIKLKKLKVFVNKRTNQHTVILPQKKLPRGKSPKYIDLEGKFKY